MVVELRAERLRILNSFLENCHAPEPGPLWPELARQKWIVLDEAGRLRMAHPFAGTVTGFAVEGGGRCWYANCIWDALTVAAMLRPRAYPDLAVLTNCGLTGEPMRIEVGDAGAEDGQARIHFAVPIRDWWKDIGFT